MSNYFKILILIFCANECLSQTDNYEVKGGRSGHQQGVKSYSGIFQDPNQHHGNQQTYQEMNQQVPTFYQPFGWNYNSQPQRTYGGVIQQTPQQGFGWFGAGQPIGNQNNPNPAFPKMPSLFLPNFVPPVYFPNTLPFPNYNPFPYPTYNQGGQFPNSQGGQYPSNMNPNAGGQFPNSQGGQYPSNINPNAGGQYPGSQIPFNNRPTGGGQHPGQNTGPNVFPDQNAGSQVGQHHHQQTSEHDRESSNNRVDSEDGKFATNAFFKPTSLDRQWTNEDEQLWQATTKAPYFENKVPGLECTLPASAVLGATTALKASSLLPLNVPVGKPILSCNATELLQAQISLNGVIYDCSRSAITMSCPRLDSNNLVVDECLGETLECDVRMRQNSRSVSCTNGTLISNSPIVCKSATLTENKNVLNCLYKGSGNSDLPLTTLPHLTTTRPTRPQYETTTSRTSVIPLAPVNENTHEDFDTRLSGTGKTDSKLTQEVKTAMKSVFPHELLSKAPSQMYLPPKTYAVGQIPDEVKNHLVGVFPHGLFAMSQTGDLNEQDADNKAESRLSGMRDLNVNNQHQFTQHRQSQWDVNVNRKTGNPGTSIKTSHQIPQRFGETFEEGDDRLIFSP